TDTVGCGACTEEHRTYARAHAIQAPSCLPQLAGDHLTGVVEGDLKLAGVLAAALGRIGSAPAFAPQALAHRLGDLPSVDAARRQARVRRHDETRLALDLARQQDYPRT